MMHSDSDAILYTVGVITKVSGRYDKTQRQAQYGVVWALIRYFIKLWLRGHWYDDEAYTAMGIRARWYSWFHG